MERSHSRVRGRARGLAVAAGLLSIGTAHAQLAPTIDGALLGDDALYGPPLWIQNQPTSLGDNVDPTRDLADGSELDVVYSFVGESALAGGGDDEYIYVLIGMNLSTFVDNRLDIFLDFKAGGQQQLRDDNVIVDGNGLNRMGAGPFGPGLKFEPGFEADYWLSFKNQLDDNGTPGIPSDDFVDVRASASNLRTGGALRLPGGNPLDYGGIDGGDKMNFDPIPFAGPRVDIQDGTLPAIFCNYEPRTTQLDPLNPMANKITITIDNSNTRGVTSGSAGDAENVRVGVEICLCLSAIGFGEGGGRGVPTTSSIRMAGFLSANQHSQVSNQVFGGLPDIIPLGEVQQVDFGKIQGIQYIELPNELVCLADFNRDGNVNTQDFIEFLNAFTNGNLRTDFAPPFGQLNTQDVLVFLNTFVDGCP